MEFLKSLIRRIFNIQSGLEKKTSFEIFVGMYELLEYEFGFFTPNELIEQYPERVDWWMGDRLEVRQTDTKESLNLISYILRKYPGSKIKSTYSALKHVHITADKTRIMLTKKKHDICPINKKLSKLKVIRDSEGNSYEESLTPVFDKYRDSFINISSSIFDLKDSGSSIEFSDRLVIADILEVFMNEYESMVTMYSSMADRDKEAIENSIRNQLKMELETVKIIRTDWTDVFQLKEEGKNV